MPAGENGARLRPSAAGLQPLMGRLDLRDPVRDEDLTWSAPRAKTAALDHWYEAIIFVSLLAVGVGLALIYLGAGVQ
jgi:hypothetical protein